MFMKEMQKGVVLFKRNNFYDKIEPVLHPEA